jgi:phospholipase/carboxylesterase
MQLDGPKLKPLSGGRATQLIVILHGVAASGQAVLFLAQAWQEFFPTAEFIVPDAPFPCDHAPEERQWFSLDDRTPGILLAGLRKADDILDRYLDELLDSRKLDDSRLALAGFSQGAAMALYAALRRRKRIAGVAAFSGSLPETKELLADIRSTPPVLLVHGDNDDAVPFKAMASAQALLEAAGVPVRAVARPGLGHVIDDAAMALGAEFLGSALGVARDVGGKPV